METQDNNPTHRLDKNKQLYRNGQTLYQLVANTVIEIPIGGNRYNPENDYIVVNKLGIKSKQVCRVIKKGERGGWVKSLDNIKGCAWVDPDAVVTDNAVVMDNACISGTAVVDCNAIVRNNAIVTGSAYVSGNAIVDCAAIVRDNARVIGNVHITDNAVVEEDATVKTPKDDELCKIQDNATISGNSLITNNATVKGYTCITGTTHIGEHAIISGNVSICGKSVIKGKSRFAIPSNVTLKDIHVDARGDVLVFTSVGSRDDVLFAYKDTTLGDLIVNIGCFRKRLGLFIAAVREEHDKPGHLQFKQQYDVIVEMIKLKFDLSSNPVELKLT